MSKSRPTWVSVILGLIVLLSPASVFAHVIVTPGQADVAQELVFNVSVPNERETAVTSVKLLIPNGVSDVTPTAKEGWTITTTKSSGQDSEIISITWSGNIPVGQRQDFSFGAQAPASAGQIDWKAYQTYADGTVVHWDQKPAGSDDATGNAGPYSVTQVFNDLTGGKSNPKSNGNDTLATTLSLVALAIATLSFVLNRKNRPSK